MQTKEHGFVPWQLQRVLREFFMLLLMCVRHERETKNMAAIDYWFLEVAFQTRSDSLVDGRKWWARPIESINHRN